VRFYSVQQQNGFEIYTNISYYIITSFIHVHKHHTHSFYNVKKMIVLLIQIEYPQRNRRLNLNLSSRASLHYCEPYNIILYNNWILQKYLWIVWTLNRYIMPVVVLWLYFICAGAESACGRVCHLVNLGQPTPFVETIADWHTVSILFLDWYCVIIIYT